MRTGVGHTPRANARVYWTKQMAEASGVRIVDEIQRRLNRPPKMRPGDGPNQTLPHALSRMDQRPAGQNCAYP